MSKENRLLFGFILVAYIFVFAFHLYWIQWASQYPQFFFNNQLMINNVDGYFFGSGAQRIVEGLHEYNPRLVGVYSYGTAVITAYLSKFLHISIDNLMLYLPAVISSIVVIPIILIGRLYRNLSWGFLAALIGGIGWSYYNRTLAGYYDTDMFSASLPMFILYFLLYSIRNKSLNALLGAVFFIIVYPFLYDQGLSIVYAMGIMAFLYLAIFHFKEEFSWKFIVILSIALMNIPWYVRVVLIAGIFYLFNSQKLEIKKLQILSLFSVILFLYTGNVFGIILAKVFSYSTKSVAVEGLKFLNVNETVREAGKIPWNVVFNRIIGSSLGLIIAVIGYILLVKKYKEFIIALPLWGIGFFAFVGGLRFTVYAVPIAAISAVYFFVYLAERYKENKKFYYGILIGGSIFILAPNITHIVGCCEKSKLLSSIEKIYPLRSYPYLVPTTFNKNEVEVLDKLKHISSPKDYVITWWDYGYPIWYYANVNTLIDGGKHNEDNFLVSKILTTSSPMLAYNLSKVSIKKYVETNKTVAPQLFIKNNKPINVNEYLMSLEDKKVDIQLNRDIYIMLPYRMFNIFPTVAYFSNRNLNTGEVYPPHFFYKNRLARKGKYLFIGNIPFDLVQKALIVNNRLIPVKNVFVVNYLKNGKLNIRKDNLNPQGLNVIILGSYGEGLILDDYYLNSQFVQMFVFENYDKNLFEPVILNPIMKIYKLK